MTPRRGSRPPSPESRNTAMTAAVVNHFSCASRPAAYGLDPVPTAGASVRSAGKAEAEGEVVVLHAIAARAHHQQARSLQPVRQGWPGSGAESGSGRSCWPWAARRPCGDLGRGGGRVRAGRRRGRQRHRSDRGHGVLRRPLRQPNGSTRRAGRPPASTALSTRCCG